MTVERTLSKVEEDFRIGDVTMARTRLLSFLTARNALIAGVESVRTW